MQAIDLSDRVKVSNDFVDAVAIAFQCVAADKRVLKLEGNSSVLKRQYQIAIEAVLGAKRSFRAHTDEARLHCKELSTMSAKLEELLLKHSAS